MLHSVPLLEKEQEWVPLPLHRAGPHLQVWVLVQGLGQVLEQRLGDPLPDRNLRSRCRPQVPVPAQVTLQAQAPELDTLQEQEPAQVALKEWVPVQAPRQE